MNIASVEVIPAGYWADSEPPRRRSFALVAVTTDDGRTGWGEASDCYGHTHPLTLRALVEEDLRWFLVDKPVEPLEELVTGLRTRVYPFLGARELAMQIISGIEVALWDLRGKARNQSISDMLGRERDEIPVYASGMLTFHHQPDEYVRMFDRALTQGIKTVKIRTGRDLEWDRSWVGSVCGLLPPDVSVLVDGKYNYTPRGAIEFSGVLADLGVIAFEEPILDTNLGAVGEAASKAAVPFAYGEHSFTVEDFRELLDHGAASILEPDVTVCGGFAEAGAVAALATERRVRIMGHCGGLSAIGLAANLQFNASLPDSMPLEYDIRDFQPLRDELLASGAPFKLGEVRGGCLRVPSGPGLGIEVDRGRIALQPYEIDRAIASAPTTYATPHI